ncbi:MAG: CDP-glucose 4,6-dehydratase [Alphaproteobacteria bacterium]|jgi:CDP-glucose 4,6-dehydratase|nr:CDP-glucose 4,6-dehydratase [Alphaproteobacteria bacterium]
MSVAFDPSFWEGRRVLITGHTGFKGSWLTFWLSRMNAQTKGIALEPDTTPNMFDAVGIGALCQHVVGDINDEAPLRRELEAFQPEVVLHLAAQSLVRRSYDDPALTFRTNVSGTVNVLNACRNCESVRSIVIVTTDKCYENNNENRAFVETDRLGGHDPYSNSKACAELVTASFRDSFFNPAEHESHHVGVASARAGNVIGGGDWCEDRLFPDAMRAFQAGRLPEIRMANAVRPWQHVLEPLYGYLLLAQACFRDGPQYARAWNFGPEKNQFLKVSDLLAKLSSRWPDGPGWTERGDASGKKEAETLFLDSSLAQERLGWRPGLSIDTILDMTLEWYKSFYDNAGKEKLSRLTGAQIDRFMEFV